MGVKLNMQMYLKITHFTEYEAYVFDTRFFNNELSIEYMLYIKNHYKVNDTLTIKLLKFYFLN